MIVIKQSRGNLSQNIKIKSNEDLSFTLTQLSMSGEAALSVDEVVIQKQNAQQLALAICPELAQEFEGEKCIICEKNTPHRFTHSDDDGNVTCSLCVIEMIKPKQ